MYLGAINIPKVEANQWQESLKSRFFSPENVRDESNGDKIHNDFLIIFHCEFSSKRGPDLRAWFRKNDRSSNVSIYGANMTNKINPFYFSNIQHWTIHIYIWWRVDTSRFTRRFRTQPLSNHQNSMFRNLISVLPPNEPPSKRTNAKRTNRNTLCNFWILYHVINSGTIFVRDWRNQQ